jgi:nucleotide-binding universal stress UspA family protein
MNAIRYVASTFGQVPAVKVTLFSVSGNPKAELFKSQKEHEEAQAKALDSSRSIMAEAQKLLVQGGFPDDHIESRVVERQNARVSDLILEEQRTGNYSAIVAGRLRLSRAEEFLFGNVAVRLARQAGCPVWVIGENLPSPP